jgi:DNA-binding NtrC family response regulator
MDERTQINLLRVLETFTFTRIGGKKEKAVNVRVVAATNRDLMKMVETNEFREDLYYRLNILTIFLPPLRERVEDIPVLARHFLEQSWRRHHSPRAAMPAFSDSAMDMLQSHHWRGNVRELQNVVEHCAVLANAGTLIAPHEIVLHNESPFGADAAGSPVVLNDAYHLAKEQVLAKFEKDYVTRLVARASGNMSRAARLASVDRTTLYRLLERHGFRRETNDTPLV